MNLKKHNKTHMKCHFEEHIFLRMKAYLILGILCVCSLFVFSQNLYQAQNSFLNHEVQQNIDEWSMKNPSFEFHSSLKPYLSSFLPAVSDSIGSKPFQAFNCINFNNALKKTTDTVAFHRLQSSPILHLQTGFDGASSRIVSETFGGAHVKLNVNFRLTFALTAVGGRVSYPKYIDTVIKTTRVIPGLGRAYRNKAGSYDFSNLSGYLSYSPNKFFNFQLGKDKRFIGDGYRSLLLSDVANNYPYFGIQTNVWRIQYNVWYAWMQDFSLYDGSQRSLQNKYGTFHFLSLNILKELNIGLFENVVWQGTDVNRVRTFDVNYLNPVVFYRPQEYAVGSPDNSMLGVTISGKIFKRYQLYAQVVADEFFLKEIRARSGWWANKQGWQFGAKNYDAFYVKGLTLKAEYNEVRPYTYTHGSVQQNYAHYAQPLAHPFGANFKEFLGFVNYHKKRWSVSLQAMYAIVGKDTAGSNLGQNIFLSYTTRPFEYGHQTTQGNKTKIWHGDARFTYFILPKMNLRLECGYLHRSVKDNQKYNLQSPYVYVGLKTGLYQFYRDGL